MSAKYFDAILRDEENLVMGIQGVMREWEIKAVAEGLELRLIQYGQERPSIHPHLYPLAATASRSAVLDAHRQAVKKGMEWESL